MNGFCVGRSGALSIPQKCGEVNPFWRVIVRAIVHVLENLSSGKSKFTNWRLTEFGFAESVGRKELLKKSFKGAAFFKRQIAR
jgi:hypothetical protein